jgi:uncharacterized lipoprotein YmbA
MQPDRALLTRKVQITRIIPLSLIIAICTSPLAGCGGGASAVNHYVIDPIAETSYSATSTDSQMAIEIVDLSVPQYLERSPIATREGGNRIAFSQSNRWGENLRKNLMRTLARNLAILLQSDDIGTPLSRSSSKPDFRLQAHIEQFERDASGVIQLRARWHLTKGGAGEPLDSYSAELSANSGLDSGNYDAMVADMQSLFGELSTRIAETISAAAGGD